MGNLGGFADHTTPASLVSDLNAEAEKLYNLLNTCSIADLAKLEVSIY